jgi:hypothetical protein
MRYGLQTCGGLKMRSYLQIIAAAVFTLHCCGATTAPLPMMSEITAMSAGIQLEFYNPAHFEQVQLIHDTVMGGRSDGSIESVSDPAGLRFYGSLSLANNGGFASVEFSLAGKLPAQVFNSIALHAAADGRTYQLRLKTPYTPRGVAYVVKFESRNDKAHYTFQPTSFVGQYRGRQVTNLPALDFADISQVSVMLADKNSGSFNIVLYSILLSPQSGI